MGRDVSLSDACGDHAQPVYDRLSAHGRDPATARVQQLYDHPERGGFREPLAPDIEQYLATDNSTARDRVKLFRLAWDIACSSFGSRQVLYERFFASDPLTRARVLNAIYPKQEVMERVLEFLGRSDDKS